MLSTYAKGVPLAATHVRGGNKIVVEPAQSVDNAVKLLEVSKSLHPGRYSFGAGFMWLLFFVWSAVRHQVADECSVDLVTQVNSCAL